MNLIVAALETLYLTAVIRNSLRTRIRRSAATTADTVNNALDMVPELNTIFPAMELGIQLNTVARLIGARDELQMERQIYFVGPGGFDLHDDQILLQPEFCSA